MKKRILILDDEPSITFSLARCLRSDSVDVISCNDSYSARRLIRTGPIDAVIADMNISEDSGECLDFIQYVRSRSSETQLIMMSALEDQKSDAFQEGANYFFGKPFDIEELIKVLHEMGFEVGQSNGKLCS